MSILKTTLRLWAVTIIVVAALGACARGPKPMHDVLPGDLFSPGAQVLAHDAFALQYAGAHYILLGEGHTVPCDHRVQADVLAALADAGQRPVLGLEMVPVDKQAVLDRFNAGEIPVDELEQALDWGAIWGHAFEVYEPIFILAHRRRIPVVALNVPGRVKKAVSAHGLDGVPEEDLSSLPDNLIDPSPEQVASLRKEFERHKGLMEDGRFERFLLVQSLWDSVMAQSAVGARADFGGPVVILAGSGHVENGWGIAHRLRTLDPTASIVSVMPWRGGRDFEPEAADLFFYCAMVHRSRLGFTLEQFPDHALVKDVAPDTKASAAGFLPGDRIVRVGGIRAEDLWVLHKAAIAARRAETTLDFTVERGAQTLTLSVPLTPRNKD